MLIEKLEMLSRIRSWFSFTDGSVSFFIDLWGMSLSKEKSFKWLKKGKLGYENEKIILAAQDQGLMTNGFKKMAKISQNDQCRFCHAAQERVS